MTAMSADKALNRRFVTKIQMPVKAAVVCYSGALAFLDGGFVRGGVPTQLTPVLGYFDNNYNNGAGSNGAINANISCDREGIVLNVGSGADALGNANVGFPVFAIDDQTVGATSGGGTRPYVGKLMRIDAQGMAWVELDAMPLPFAVMAVAGAGIKIAFGQHVTVAASDTVVTGLAQVVAAFAILDSAPVLACATAQASIGNQAGAPAAGSILLETFMPTSNANPTPIPATTFGKTLSWFAIGF